MSQFTPEPTTKDKLNSIVQGFDDFDLEMRKGTRVSFNNNINNNIYLYICI